MPGILHQPRSATTSATHRRAHETRSGPPVPYNPLPCGPRSCRSAADASPRISRSTLRASRAREYAGHRKPQQFQLDER